MRHCVPAKTGACRSPSLTPMGVPDFQSLMRPVLESLSDGDVHRGKEIRDEVKTRLALSDDDLAEVLASGQTRYYNRLQWAFTHLAKAGAVERPQRGEFRITDRGRDLLASCPERITLHDLSQYPEFMEFRAARRSDPGTRTPAQVPHDTLTPPEQIEALISDMGSAVMDELLAATYAAGDEFLERLSVSLLTAMGYGGTERNSRTARTNDLGIDGIIRQDALGLDMVAVQAKCWAPDRSVKRPDLQAFVGAMHGAQTTRGVFITTAKFTAGAREYAEQVGVQLVLIDGDLLARLLFEHGLGVSVKQTYEIREFDRDFFEEA